MSSAQMIASGAVPRVAPSPVAAPFVPARPAVEPETGPPVADDLLFADDREKFIPLTRNAIADRLTRPQHWRQGDAQHARRFFRFLSYWRQQSYAARLLELDRIYEPFSPDSDLLITRKFSPPERLALERQLVSQVKSLLQGANFTRIDPSNVEMILTKESHYGLDLHVDLKAFDELEIYYRGATHRKASRRSLRKFYLRKEEYEVPVFQRLFILFKLKSAEKRAREIMLEKGCSLEDAEQIVKRNRSMLPVEVKSDFVYMKLFKNIPRADIEMVFPNTKVRFRLFDKVKLGVSAGGGLGMGVIGTAGKLAVATNPVALAGAVAGLGGIAFRQAVAFMNQKNRYMVTMAQNLYFHALADNRGVMSLMANRAAEEDVKEEMLLYTVLAKERVNRREMKDVDHAIEQYLLNTFGVNLNFDVEDALSRLIADGVVLEEPDGTLRAMPPQQAAQHIDMLWDKLLDELPDIESFEGREFDPEDEGADAASA